MDQEQVAELYRRHVPPMRAFACMLLDGDYARAEELVHDAFITSVARFTGLRDAGRFEAYLRRSVRNAVISWGRRQALERRWLSRQRGVHAGADRSYEDVEQRDRVVEVLRRLPMRQRMAVTARICLDLSETETAELLGCSVGTVKSLTSRGLAALRVTYADGSELTGDTR